MRDEMPVCSYMGSGGGRRSPTPLLAHVHDRCWASRRGITYSLMQHHTNGQNSSDNNVMVLKPRNVNTIITGNVGNTYGWHEVHKLCSLTRWEEAR